ncbi:hypothetical protein HYFRA_00001545 [Hymenoscyphus fraxineus]|uniref:Cytochrome P450 n=1 Tax=Hymenoscyphus fraxineus TaxID=746836 RepID=A0A9N9L8U8_9HELO|nr:hypothetical protein HYFRA_00001545 [Hymenoscyphus fraxineus]
MGQELYIVTSPKDVLSVYKNSKGLDFNPIIKEIMASFGLRASTLDKMFDLDSNGKCWMDTAHGIFKLQMHPGEKLDELQATFLGNIDKSLNWEKLVGPMVLSNSGNEAKSVSLFKWCGEVLVDSATRAFFGDSIFHIDPNLLADFFVFDADSWKLSYQYPYFAAKDMYDAKKKGETAFAKYLALPREQREDASWVTKSIEDGIEGLGIREESQSSPMLFVLFRLINTNAYRLCFWCLAYLLHDKMLLNDITSEIQPAFQSDGSLNMQYLLDSCPLLDSLYEEILRISNYPIGVRVVTTEVAVGDTLLQPGRQLLMPYSQMHFDPEFFGSNANEFDAKRFLNNRRLVRSSSYRPFGGGLTQCPGRFLARREVYLFLAQLLNRFDIALVSEKGRPQFPKMDVKVPSGGVMGPEAGEDVIVNVRRKL